jgi:hypothetical protein
VGQAGDLADERMRRLSIDIASVGLAHAESKTPFGDR